jgi:hypothetical protein
VLPASYASVQRIEQSRWDAGINAPRDARRATACPPVCFTPSAPIFWKLQPWPSSSSPTLRPPQHSPAGDAALQRERSWFNRAVANDGTPQTKRAGPGHGPPSGLSGAAADPDGRLAAAHLPGHRALAGADRSLGRVGTVVTAVDNAAREAKARAFYEAHAEERAEAASCSGRSRRLPGTAPPNTARRARPVARDGLSAAGVISVEIAWIVRGSRGN